MISIPFSLIGGIWLIYTFGYNVSESVSWLYRPSWHGGTYGMLVLCFIDVEISKICAAGSPILSADVIKGTVLSSTSLRVRPIIIGPSYMSGTAV